MQAPWWAEGPHQLGVYPDDGEDVPEGTLSGSINAIAHTFGRSHPTPAGDPNTGDNVSVGVNTSVGVGVCVKGRIPGAACPGAQDNDQQPSTVHTATVPPDLPGPIGENGPTANQAIAQSPTR